LKTDARLPPKDPDFVWLNGKIVTWNESKVPILTHALHYGTAVFEGIRAYPSEDNLNIFRLREHFIRLMNSAKVYYLSIGYSIEELMQAAVQVVRKNGYHERTYIRPLVFVGYGGIGLDFTGVSIETAIIAVPFFKYFSKPSVRVKISTWRRISHESNPPMAKASGNYLNSVLAKFESLSDGYDEAIMLDHRGYLSEGTGENIFLVKDGLIYTPPMSSGILAGITRATVIKLASDLGYNVVERDIDRAELYSCEEAFFSGTAAEVTPITEVDRRIVGDGQPGPITTKIRDTYLQVVEGRNERYMHWLTPVY
jgi:branched-chain amino acid aminotransferase